MAGEPGGRARQLLYGLCAATAAAHTGYGGGDECVLEGVALPHRAVWADHDGCVDHCHGATHHEPLGD